LRNQDARSVRERREAFGMALHKHVFEAAVLDLGTGEVAEERFSADRVSLARWAEAWRGEVVAVVIEATTGWRWVWRELVCHGFEVRLAEPVQARGLLGRRRSAKTDRLDARWLAWLLAKEMLPESWIPPEEIRRLRDRTRLRKALAEDRRRWGQRLHAFLMHEGWPCSRARLLTPPGLRWAAALKLSEHARLQVDSLLAIMAALETQLDTVDAELRRFARADERCRALQSIYGIGPILACHLLAEIGEVRRFRRAEQITRLAGLDPSVDDSGDTRRRGKLAKARLAASSLGTRRGSRARASIDRSRRRSLPRHPRAAQRHRRETDCRPEDR
jgi:transposase